MKYWEVSLTILILLNLSLQQAVMAQPVPSHLVPVEELQNQLAEQSGQRRQNIQEIQKLLRHELVRREVGSLVDLEKVEVALGTLDDETLRQLADDSRNVSDQLEAGLATWAWITIIAAAVFTTIFLAWLFTMED
jgi:hypothetical protein